MNSSQAETRIHQLNQHKTLILDQAYQPIGIVSWEKAIYLWLAHKAEVLNFFPDLTVNSPAQQFQLPAVLRVRWLSRRRKMVHFSRVSVMARDNFSCAYCGNQFPANKLTLDHIIPFSKGGERNWENIVCACFKCNHRKANRTPEQAGMDLLFEPYVPNWNIKFLLQLNQSSLFEEWKEFLNF